MTRRRVRVATDRRSPPGCSRWSATFTDRSDNPDCADCHIQGTYHAGLTQAHTAREPGDCDDCHLLVLPNEHSRSTSNSHSGGCATCHPLPGSFDWTGLCADCHGPGGRLRSVTYRRGPPTRPAVVAWAAVVTRAMSASFTSPRRKGAPRATPLPRCRRPTDCVTCHGPGAPRCGTLSRIRQPAIHRGSWTVTA